MGKLQLQKWGIAFISAVFVALLGVIFTWISTSVMRDYGWTLFIALPVVLGLSNAFLLGFQGPYSLRQAFITSIMSMAFYGLGLLVFALEGLICLLMALPLATPFVVLGTFLGYIIDKRSCFRKPGQSHAFMLLGLMPLMLILESNFEKVPEQVSATTSIEINAPRERVWQYIVEFPHLEEPEEWLFRLGIAYPTHAEFVTLDGRKARECHFNTGTFVEPITAWDEPSRLAFDVLDQPVPMHELSVYEIHPPHLNGYFVSHRGEFRLIELQGRRTRIEGTTWYSVNIWPQYYWQLWCDYIVHQIHQRVLVHIKTLAEGAK